jgi:pyridoxamine 5'-phosphate oxidase
MRVIPDRIEFWYGHEDRLHERFEYRLERGVWIERILSP